MFIKPLSDIHNEFSVYQLPEHPEDGRTNLVLAGDVALADSINSTLVPFLDSVTDRFANILYIPGNHEYYHSSLMRADTKLEAACKRYSNVFYMQERTMMLEDVMFIGATLWTDYNRGNPMAMMAAQSDMNDYKHIRTGSAAAPYLRKSRPLDMLGINHRARLFIENGLRTAQHSGNRAVVFTHHAMTMMARTNAYPHGPLDYAYYNTGLEDMILEYEPVLCIHGHSHHAVDFMLGNTRMLSNPRGYTKDANSDEGLGFNAGLLVEL